MGADEFEVEIDNDILTLRFKVKPVGENQRDDEEHLHEMQLLSVTIDDDYIITRFIDYVKNNIVSELCIEIISRKKCLAFSVDEGASKLNALTFNIKAKTS